MVPEEVAAAWGWQDAEIAALPGGLINRTYAVRVAGAPVAVLQRLHPVFGAKVNLDIEAVTAHLAARGLITPRLIRTRDGCAWLDERSEEMGVGSLPAGPPKGGDRPRGIDQASGVWRALSWVEGATVHTVPDPAWAEAGGALVGEFHRAVADLSHDYAFARGGVHDTAAHLARLAAHVTAGGDAVAIALGSDILEAARALPAMPDVPLRHCHGDLKISNLLFAVSPRAPQVRGVCLVDLDTIGLSTLAFDLGDALRSWCNPFAEDAGSAAFDLAIFAAAIRGFRAIAERFVTADEKTSIVVGLETVCLELAARFAIDVFRDEYFGWNPSRFPSRRAHNLVRAQGQLALGLAVRSVRDDALAIVRSS